MALWKELLVTSILALTVAACATASSTGNGATLRTGMTSNEVITALGQPDLKDTVADPNNPGSTVGRYVWLDSGQVALFGSDGRVASVQRIAPVEKAPTEQAQAQTERPVMTHPFDPIQTPLDYAFFPLKAAIIYGATGLQCVTTGPCTKPHLPSPS